MIEIVPLTGIGDVAPGDDLAALLRVAIERQGLALRTGDVLVVTQKIVSKAENRFVDLDTVEPSERAVGLAAVTHKDPRFVEVVLRESDSVVRAVPNVLIVRHRSGWVMANAGIDRSNTGKRDGRHVLLLPADPDASASALRSALHLPVVISDSFGRPWRVGVVAVALGAAGLPALLDRRGEVDRDGHELEITQVAVADILATAASLVMGEGAESVPAAIVRGYELVGEPRPARDLVRPVTEDLFR